MAKRHFLLVTIAISVLGCDKRNAVQEKAPIYSKDSVGISQQLVTVRVQLSHTADSTFAAKVDSSMSFGIRDTIHALVKTEHASNGMQLMGRWTYLRTGYLVAENKTSLQAGTNVTHFDLINNNPWPQGVYRLEVYLDSALKDSIRFTVANMR